MDKNHKQGKKMAKGKANLYPKSELMLNTLELKPFHPVPIYKKKFRYKIATAVVGQTVTCQNIFAAWVQASTTTSARSIIGNMRIRHVAIVGNTTGFEELYCRDANQQGYVDSVDSTNVNGNTSVIWRPKPKSLSSDWFNFGTYSGNTPASLFTFSAPVNSILELAVDFVLSGAAGSIGGQVYTSTFTAGVSYSMGLDGAPGSIYYTAIGMNSA